MVFGKVLRYIVDAWMDVVMDDARMDGVMDFVHLLGKVNMFQKPGRRVGGTRCTYSKIVLAPGRPGIFVRERQPPRCARGVVALARGRGSRFCPRAITLLVDAGRRDAGVWEVGSILILCPRTTTLSVFARCRDAGAGRRSRFRARTTTLSVCLRCRSAGAREAIALARGGVHNFVHARQRSPWTWRVVTLAGGRRSHFRRYAKGVGHQSMPQRVPLQVCCDRHARVTQAFPHRPLKIQSPYL